MPAAAPSPSRNPPKAKCCHTRFPLFGSEAGGLQKKTSAVPYSIRPRAHYSGYQAGRREQDLLPAVPEHAPAGRFSRRAAGFGDACGRTPVHSGESLLRAQKEMFGYSQIQKKLQLLLPHSRNTAHPRRRAGQAVPPHLLRKILRFRRRSRRAVRVQDWHRREVPSLRVYICQKQPGCRAGQNQGS